MSTVTEQLSLNLPISEARAVCQNAIGGLGWRTASAGADQLEIDLPASGTHNRQRISILLQAAGDDQTTVILGGKIGGVGPIQKHHLSASMSRVRDAITNNVEGIFLRDCKLLGGHGHGIAPGTTCTVLFRPDEAQVSPVGEEPVRFRYEDVDSLEIGGKGLVQRGGSFIGGGIGAEGALVGMGIASVLNSLTSSSRIDTVININGSDRQAWIHYPRETPQALNVRLSGILAKIESARRSKVSLPGSATSVSDELARIHELHTKGVLTAEEYAEAKAKLIGRL